MAKRKKSKNPHFWTDEERLFLVEQRLQDQPYKIIQEDFARIFGTDIPFGSLSATLSNLKREYGIDSLLELRDVLRGSESAQPTKSLQEHLTPYDKLFHQAIYERENQVYTHLSGLAEQISAYSAQNALTNLTLKQMQELPEEMKKKAIRLLETNAEPEKLPRSIDIVVYNPHDTVISALMPVYARNVKKSTNSTQSQLYDGTVLGFAEAGYQPTPEEKEWMGLARLNAKITKKSESLDEVAEHLNSLVEIGNSKIVILEDKPLYKDCFPQFYEK